MTCDTLVLLINNGHVKPTYGYIPGYSNPPSTRVLVTPKTRGFQVRPLHGFCSSGLYPPSTRVPIIRSPPLLLLQQCNLGRGLCGASVASLSLAPLQKIIVTWGTLLVCTHTPFPFAASNSHLVQRVCALLRKKVFMLVPNKEC